MRGLKSRNVRELEASADTPMLRVMDRNANMNKSVAGIIFAVLSIFAIVSAL